MKKSIVLLIALSIMLLAACGAGDKALTKKEVLSQTIEKAGELESYSADMKIETDAMGMEVTIDGKSDITHNPDTLYMEMTMGMPGMAMDTEAYFADGEVFMGALGEWFIMSEEDLGLDSFDQLNTEELAKFNEFEEQFEMEEDDDFYILTLAGEGEEFEILAETYVQSVMEDFPAEEDLGEASLDFSVKSLELKLQIEKETMLPKSQSVNAEIEMDGEVFKIEAETTIANINEIEPVEIPDEVRENAITEEFLDEDIAYEEESMTLEEIQEFVDYTVPQVSSVPDGFELTHSYYDEYLEIPYFIYGNDSENSFTLSVYPSKDEYDDIILDEVAETVSINGQEGILEVLEEDFMYLTWEHQGLFLELISEGSEISKDILIEIAESVK